MSVKLVAIDLDGTLLTDKKQINEDDIKAINVAREKGVHIVFASGRHLDGVKTTLETAGNTDYCISSAGAIVTDVNGDLAYSRCLDEKETHAALEFLKDRNLYIQVYPPLKRFLYPYRCEYTDIYEDHCTCKGDYYEGLYDVTDMQSSKLLIIDEYEVLSKLKDELIAKFPEFNIVFSQKDHLEIIKGGASKADAIKAICGITGIDMSETLSIGDAEIDLSMIKATGFSACPANSIDIIKEKSTYISKKTNNECAVADVLRHFLGE